MAIGIINRRATAHERNAYSTRDMPVLAQAPTIWHKENLESVSKERITISKARSPGG